MDRPKQGFGIPIAQGLRGSVKDWAKLLLAESQKRQEGGVNKKLLRAVSQNDLAGR
jgi:asparagine synthase (glutamine-hydrolysing)